MISTLRRIVCDFCRHYKRGQEGFTDEVETDNDMIELAGSMGWSRQPGWNEATWDCCPTCAVDGTKEKAVAPEPPELEAG